MVIFEKYISEKFNLKKDELEEILFFFKLTFLKKNQFLILSGRKCDRIAFIQQGVMRNYTTDEQGNEVTNYMTSDGDFNTVYSYLINGDPCPENIQAVTDCQLLVIEREQFFQLKNASNQFGLIIEKLVADGLECKELRLKSYLTEDAQKRYANLIHRQPKVVQFTPMKYIASYLGITRETLSRIRNRKLSIK